MRAFATRNLFLSLKKTNLKGFLPKGDGLFLSRVVCVLEEFKVREEEEQEESRRPPRPEL